MELSDGRFKRGAWRGCHEGMSMTRSKPLHRHAWDTCQGVTTNSKSSNHNDLPCSTPSLYSTAVAVFTLVGFSVGRLVSSVVCLLRLRCFLAGKHL
jgi:hypothetical protein